jgi:hypothetical protein
MNVSMALAASWNREWSPFPRPAMDSLKRVI